jgi:hypothetical protein
MTRQKTALLEMLESLDRSGAPALEVGSMSGVGLGGHFLADSMAPA